VHVIRFLLKWVFCSLAIGNYIASAYLESNSPLHLIHSQAATDVLCLCAYAVIAYGFMRSSGRRYFPFGDLQM
jgi:hypothetical protein